MSKFKELCALLALYVGCVSPGLVLFAAGVHHAVQTEAV